MKPRNSIGRSIVCIILMSILFLAAFPVPAEEMVKSIDQITTGIRDREMLNLWQKAHQNGNLPPLEGLPIPAVPVSQRRPAENMDKVDFTVRRPVIAENTPIDVQVFTKDVSLTEYQGTFSVSSHKAGTITGKIEKSREALEILYKLPQSRQLKITPESDNLYLSYFHLFKAGSNQRRILLLDRNTRTAKVLSVAEGSERPVRITLKELELTIEQEARPDSSGNPPVTFTYKDDSLTLRQGEQKSFALENQEVWIYLLNSFAINPKLEIAEGQPYYVYFIIYE